MSIVFLRQESINCLNVMYRIFIIPKWEEKELGRLSCKPLDEIILVVINILNVRF